MELKYIEENNKYNNIRQVLKNEFNMSNRLITRLKKNNAILLNGSVTYLDKSICNGDIIKCIIDFKEDSVNIIPTKMDLKIIYEDEYILAVDKPPNLAAHPSILHYTNSLSNGIKYYFEENKIYRKIRPVNRLDRDTTGIVIFAKNEYIQECLIRGMQDGTFYKEYVAILEGILNIKNGVIDAPISRKEGSIIERKIDMNGVKAITNYSVIKEKNDLSLVKFILKTGRTHQIRLHSKHIGHPILGDTLYGSKSDLITRQALHCYKIIFKHPILKKDIELIADIPSDITSII